MIYQLELLENGGITSTTAAHLLAIIMVFVVAMVDLQPFQTRKGIFDCGTVGQSVKRNNNVSIDNSKIASPYNINPPLQSPSSLSDKPAHTKQSDIIGEFQQRISKLTD
jgi:hypothetical protein